MPANMLRSFKIYTCTNGTLGLHLSRAPWDPYPWVSSIQKDSTSYQAGVRIGDCLLELNSQDVLGMKISEIAALLKNHWLNESSNYVTVVIWRNKCNINNANTEHTTANDCNKTFNGDGSNNHNHHADDGDGDGDDDDEDEENNAHNINQQSLQKFATCLQHIAQLLECPVCLEVIKPPGWQCCNGHVLCNNCRNRSEKCPVCRVPLGPRGRCLLSDKLFTLLADSFPCDGATAGTATSSAFKVENEKELNSQKPVHQSQRATPATEWKQHDKNDDKYSKAQQAHKITLQQIKNEKSQQEQQQQQNITALTMKAVNQNMQQDDELSENVLESNENEHLLGGQEQRQVTKNTAAAVERVNFKETPTAASDTPNSEGKAAGNLKRLGSNQSFIATTKTNAADFATTTCGALIKNIDLQTDCKLELHEFPKEMMQSQNSINEQNGSTIILTPTQLTTVTHAGQTTINGRHDGGAPNVTSYNGDGAYKGPKFWQYLVKNYSVSSQQLALFLAFISVWILAYILMPEYAVPSTGIMRLILLIVGAQIAGVLVTFLKVPDMLGMLFFGVLYTNLGWADFSGYQKLASFLREMALINIMLLAGLGLDGSAFRKLWFMILRLTLIPTIAEVAVIAILAYFLLNMSWLWGILLGLVITAVSPNVVVTVMLKLKEERLGLNNGIHTLIYAMTTCNDVVAIFLFGVFCGIIFSTGSLTEQILQGPIGIGIGIVFGYVYGLMLKFVPSRNANYVNGLRFILTVLGGTIAVMGSKAIGYPSAGALGCVTVAFTAGIGWKHQEKKLTPQQLQAYENANVSKRLDLMWKFLKPVSFSLIGKEINFDVLDGKVVGYGALLVLLGSVFRLSFAYLSTYGGNLTKKERGYITISGFPKATVQAALGPIALDLARSLNADAENLSLASNVLIISVLAIIFTAPLGAILMLRLAPFWLKHSPLNNDNLADDNRRGNVVMANYHITTNFLTNESAGNDNLDRNQKSV